MIAKFIMETNLVIFMVIIFLGWHGLKYPLYIYRTARGLYYRDRYVSLLEGIGNVALSVIMVQQMGLAGVLGTIISSLFTTISASYLIFHYFERTVLDWLEDNVQVFSNFYFDMLGELIS